MNNVTVTDNLPRFRNNLVGVLNDAFRESARDGLVNARTSAPYDKGGLRSESETHMVSMLWWRISFWKEYARFQEFGGDAKRRVRNYKTSGTGKGFLKKAGDDQAKKLNMTIRKHTVRARA